MRYLSIDLGGKRTGIAVGDSITGIVTPLAVIEAAGEALVNALVVSCVQHLGPKGELVVGLPLNMDGTEGGAAKAVRQFGAVLTERTKLTVHFMDERLSSVQADWEMSQSGLTRGQKKGKRDALAAAAILRDFLARTREGGAGEGRGGDTGGPEVR